MHSQKWPCIESPFLLFQGRSAVAFRYQGDVSGPYDHARKTGMVGKVFGPDASGVYRIVTEATYDSDLDATIVTSAILLDPAAALARLQETTS